MALYLIGDVQGCDDALGRLLHKIAYSPSRDTIYLLGDLVNRGPASAQVLRRLMHYGQSAQCLLGNHDLSLLAVAQGHRSPHPRDTMDAVLAAPDRAALLDWLRHRPLAIREHGLLMVHAGVLPQWDAAQVMALAGEVERTLQSGDYDEFLAQMFGNLPDRWDDALTGFDRLRIVVNALTRLRFCTPDGVMHLKASGTPDNAPEGTLPWFMVPGRRTQAQVMAVGHWSTLGVVLRPKLLALDSGCVWGGCLSALRIDPQDPARHELIQVDCEQAQPHE
ncbi:symmetrical bis(5'-nucleosyl)-tetraphosphatase [Ramlibacter rhizophilus]|uniref:bis(5'-nucleosyl)-tetraphosphatase (symmetrical) n=1 Tax=Ramlibacter rhizophilus TaxID=1781167 RepID=A0A4Z0BTM6_9BURK|nr:symmetrical bis(5'-nucleosyl)-tetraphosphatase [Ramlibacter rhizophilus]TFZ01349.1 symmetrical bis(5'-nucleosyl)-tetraphosphatase [Ramlibacter rhizophilus]